MCQKKCTNAAEKQYANMTQYAVGEFPPVQNDPSPSDWTWNKVKSAQASAPNPLGPKVDQVSFTWNINEPKNVDPANFL